MVTAVAIVWRALDLIESELLAPGALVDPMRVEIVSLSGSRVVLRDDGPASIDGVWGVRGADGYAQMTPVVSQTAEGVERGFAVVRGSFEDGETVELDANAFPDDPRAAHGLPYEEIRVPGELGVNPAWLITGEVDTWAVIVHGKQEAGRQQALRALPTFRRLGLPVLVITYRNDASGGAPGDRRYTWGLDEWRDLEAALDTATLRGADDFVLMGFDMGASIIATFLQESERAPDVRGVVFDSAILDLEALADDVTDEHGIPGFLAGLAKGVARLRFGLEWSRLNQLEHAPEFDPNLPVLMMHGGADTVTPIQRAEAIASRLPNVVFERFEQAGHGALWNSESVRYDDVLTRFLVGLVPDLMPDADIAR